MKRGIHFLFGAKDNADDYKTIIDRFASVGFDCVELPPDPFLENPEKAVDIVKYAEAKNVEIVYSCGFDAAFDMASEDETIRQNGVRHLQEILQVMDLAGIRLLGGTCYTKWPSYRTKPLSLTEKNSIIQRTAEVFSGAVTSLEDRGITVALEPLNRFEGFLMNTAAEGVAFCDMVGNPNVGLMLDGFHMSVEEDDVIGSIAVAGKRLKHLHLAENNRKLPGLGCFPWEAFFSALKKIGYTGRLNIESFMTPEGSIAASVALWRDLGLADENQMLIDSLAFIDRQCVAAGLGIDSVLSV